MAGRNGVAGTIDWQKFREVERDVGSDSIRRLLRIFIKECDTSCKSMALLSKSGDCKQIEVVAHSLKSSARQFGAISLSEQCRRVEAIAGKNEMAGIDQILKALLAEVGEVQKALTGWLGD